MLTGALKYAGIKFAGKNEWLQYLMSEIYAVSFPYRLLRTLYFALTNFCGNKHTTAKMITQTMDGCKISRQKKYNIHQKMDDCHSFYNRHNGYLPLFLHQK